MPEGYVNPLECERTSGRMIAANSLGWVPTRDFWVGEGVNSILTLVPSSSRAGSKLPSKRVLDYPCIFHGSLETSSRLIYNLLQTGISISQLRRLWRTHLDFRGYAAPFICSLSSRPALYSYWNDSGKVNGQIFTRLVTHRTFNVNCKRDYVLRDSEDPIRWTQSEIFSFELNSFSGLSDKRVRGAMWKGWQNNRVGLHHRCYCDHRFQVDH